MSRHYFLSAILILSSFSAIPRETLPFSVLPTNNTANEVIWNLSQKIGENSEFAIYKQFGDTLLSETLRNNRRWYRTSCDSTFFIREESDSYFILPAQKNPASVLCHKEILEKGVYESTGKQYSMFFISRKGSYRCEGPVKGRIITTHNDTLSAFMTSEYEEYVEKTSPIYDTLLPNDYPDSLTQRSVTLFRWFLPGRKIPVAVQCDISERLPGMQPSNQSFAYISDLNSICNKGTNSDEFFRKILSNASVNYENGAVTIHINSDIKINLNISILSEGGISYYHSDHSVYLVNEIKIPAGNLPHGRNYIILLCGDLIEKRLILIN